MLLIRYTLEVPKEQVVIEALAQQGLFYGANTCKFQVVLYDDATKAVPGNTDQMLSATAEEKKH